MSGETQRPCPACGAIKERRSFECGDLRLMTTERSFTVRECQECSTLFLDPPLSPGDLLRHYPDEYFRRETPSGILARAMERYRILVLKSHARRIALEALNAGKPPGEARILDVGAGNTRLARLLRPQGFRITSLDISPRAFEAPAPEEEAEVIVASAEKTGLRDSSFDVVSLFHSLEHSADPGAVLGEARRILGPGGRLLIEVPDSGSLESKFAGKRWYGLDVPRHAVSFTAKGLLGLLSRSGFRPVSIRHFCLRDSAPSLVSSLFPGLDPSRRRTLHRLREKTRPFAPGWTEILYFMLVVLSLPVAFSAAAAGKGAVLSVSAVKEPEA